MPTYAEAIKFEESAPKNIIRLVKSGEFYRAYNRSAWLFHCCIAEHKVMRKYLKTFGFEIFYIGFPEKSLFNNIGERKSEKTDLGFDIELTAEEIPNDEEYDIWKNNIETQQSSKCDYFSLPLSGIEAEKEVIKRIKEFPLESRSMVECVVFLSDIRKLLVNK